MGGGKWPSRLVEGGRHVAYKSREPHVVCMTLPSPTAEGWKGQDLPGFEPILLKKRQGGVSLLKHVGRKREGGTRSSRLRWEPAVPPAIDRMAAPAWEGTDGPLCSVMNHTPVMGDVHKHESKGKYIKSAEVYVQGGAWMGCSHNEPGVAPLCSLSEGSGYKNITNVYLKMGK